GVVGRAARDGDEHRGVALAQRRAQGGGGIVLAVEQGGDGRGNLLDFPAHVGGCVHFASEGADPRAPMMQARMMSVPPIQMEGPGTSEKKMRPSPAAQTRLV